MTGGAGGDRFWLGDENTVFYDDGVRTTVGDQNYGLITDFNPEEGDILQLHGKADDYKLVFSDRGTEIYLDLPNFRGIQDELIGIISNRDSFDLNADYVDYVPDTKPPIIIPPVIIGDLVSVSFAPVISNIEAKTTISPLNPPSLADFDTTSPQNWGARSAKTSLINSIFATDAIIEPIVLNNGEIKTLGSNTVIQPINLTNLESQPELKTLENDDDSFTITQTEDPKTLLKSLFANTAGLSNIKIDLLGDYRAFGTFSNDPFGLGSGIVLSTGKVADLDGENGYDGDYSPGVEVQLEFEPLANSVAGGTGVFRANLSDIGFAINSLTIADNGIAEGGSSGDLSGLDLDAIKISNVLITDAQDIDSIPSFNLFDFSPANTFLTPGSQRSGNRPIQPNLFGTINGYLNNGIASLGEFDYTNNPNFDGFATLGDGGKIGFNLQDTLEPEESIYLYIGEAGNNEAEAISGEITVSNRLLNEQSELSTDFGAAGTANDKIVLDIEFEADAFTEELFFQFVFGSEEFVEFGGSEFNDSFSIKLNGLDLAHLSNGDAATINNLVTIPFGNYSEDFIYNPTETGPASDTIKLDGYTEVLTFGGAVIPNATNKLTITIEDVRDGLLDTAAFIKGGSLMVTSRPGVRTDKPELFVAEERKDDVFNVSLTTKPSKRVKVTLDPDKQLDLGEGKNKPIVLTFTPKNYDISQTVEVKAFDDHIVEGLHTGLIEISTASKDEVYANLEPNTITAQIRDNDFPNRIEGTRRPDKLIGTKAADLIQGFQGDDLLNGKGDRDTLIGGEGNDFLKGGNSDDVLYGGIGKDKIKGGKGKDTIVFDSIEDGVDKIIDFRSGKDILQISADGFGGNLQPGVLPKGQFVLGKAEDANDRFIYKPNTGKLFFDVDGIGQIDPIQIAVLTNQEEISARDFAIT